LREREHAFYRFREYEITPYYNFGGISGSLESSALDYLRMPSVVTEFRTRKRKAGLLSLSEC